MLSASSSTALYLASDVEHGSAHLRPQASGIHHPLRRQLPLLARLHILDLDRL